MVVGISLAMAAHMLVGSVVVGSGAAALLCGKGTRFHQLAGRMFAGSILLMGPIVAAGAWMSPGSISPLGILFMLFIIYLVASAWSTIHRSAPGIRLLDMLAPAVALCISIACLVVGYDAINNPGPAQDAPPTEAYFFFALFAFVAMLLDLNNVKRGGVRGKHRIIRHVWRMSCALFFATSSLFTGPGAIMFPESVRGNPLMLIPQTLVVFIAIVWLYRSLFSKQHRYQ